MLEAPFEAVDGVEQAADSIAVDIDDVAGDRCPKLPAGPFDVRLSS